MKKINVNILIIISLLLIATLVSCTKITPEKIDYSEYPFTDTVWTRDAEHDVESIIFYSDGSFAYYCACGNSVNDSDLNNGYTYDDETKTITVNYFETTDETVSTIIIEACDNENIKLNFDGEIREFIKEKEIKRGN